jgi:hypothetical protein
MPPPITATSHRSEKPSLFVTSSILSIVPCRRLLQTLADETIGTQQEREGAFRTSVFNCPAFNRLADRTILLFPAWIGAQPMCTFCTTIHADHAINTAQTGLPIALAQERTSRPP